MIEFLTRTIDIFLERIILGMQFVFTEFWVSVWHVNIVCEHALVLRSIIFREITKRLSIFFVGSWKLHVSFVGKRYILSSVLDLNIRTGGAFAHIMHDILRGTSPLIYSRKRANILTNVTGKLPYRVCSTLTHLSQSVLQRSQDGRLRPRLALQPSRSLQHFLLKLSADVTRVLVTCVWWRHTRLEQYEAMYK